MQVYRLEELELWRKKIVFTVMYHQDQIWVRSWGRVFVLYYRKIYVTFAFRLGIVWFRTLPKLF